MESWIAAVKAPSNHKCEEAIAPWHMITTPPSLLKACHSLLLTSIYPVADTAACHSSAKSWCSEISSIRSTTLPELKRGPAPCTHNTVQLCPGLQPLHAMFSKLVPEMINENEMPQVQASRRHTATPQAPNKNRPHRYCQLL
jgi:hypothetical protein